MLVEGMAVVTAETAVATRCMLVDMPRSPMFEAGTLAILERGAMVLLCALAGATVVRCLRVGMRAMQGGARITRLAAEAGLEAEAGEAVTGIRTMDTPGSAITAWATATRMADITVTDPVGATIRITDIVRADLILTDTGTGLIWASASAVTKLNQHR
jgi:hypothetical protein